MRRLFSTFAGGPPGIGLLLIRLLAGSTVVCHAIMILRTGPPLGGLVFAGFLIGLGLMLIAGLWTPAAASLITIIALWDAFAYAGDRRYSVMVAVLSLALALLGPGAWSVDARLFGWKRL